MLVKIAGPVPLVPITELFRFPVTVIFCIQGIKGVVGAMNYPPDFESEQLD